MQLTIYHNIVYGTLKPWHQELAAERFYRQQLTPPFCKPQQSIKEYYQALKALHPEMRELFQKDGLAIYLLQPDAQRHPEIL